MKSVFFVLLFCGIAASAVEIVNFNNTGAWYLNAHVLRKQTWQSVSKDDKKEGSTAVITLMPSGKTNFIEFYLRHPIVIAANEVEFNKRALVFDANLSKARDLWAFAIRCRDAKGEYFQFTVSNKLSDNIWGTVIIPLAAASRSSWGGNNDKKVDFPLTLLGFVPTYTKTLKAPLTVKFHGVSIDEME